jgi:hypothetical protein
MTIEEALDIMVETNYSLFTNEKERKAFDMALFGLSIWAGVKEDVSELESLGDPLASVIAESFKNRIVEIEKIGD